MTRSSGDDVQAEELRFTDGGSVNWWICCELRFTVGGSVNWWIHYGPLFIVGGSVD